jgi:hypothetical protein
MLWLETWGVCRVRPVTGKGTSCCWQRLCLGGEQGQRSAPLGNLCCCTLSFIGVYLEYVLLLLRLVSGMQYLAMSLGLRQGVLYTHEFHSSLGQGLANWQHQRKDNKVIIMNPFYP